MKTDMKKTFLEDQTIEFVICFTISAFLILHFLFRPESAMTKAVVDNDVTKIKQMIRITKHIDEPGPCRQTHSLYSTPLIEAAWLGRTEVLVELLNAGANVDARDEFGTTPLLAALSRGDIRISLVLLEKGANPNIATCLGHGSCTTALRCARKINDAKLIAKIDSEGGREDTPFFFPIECFWMDLRPVVLLACARIVPLVFCVMMAGSLIRRKIRKTRIT